jgi:hypothetical protein
MGVKWGSTSAICTLQKSLWFSSERSTDSILIEFGMPLKIVRLFKICISETYSKAHIGKILKNIIY